MSTLNLRTAPIERLHELFDCDFETGFLTRKKMMGGKHAGTRAGSLNNLGYRAVSVDRVKLLEHRVVYAMAYGEWPPKGCDIDHINMQRDDNRLVNLRLATRSENRLNSRPQSNNTSGYKGVTFDKKKRMFLAQAMGRFVGYFKCPKEAHGAYCEYMRNNHAEFARVA